MAVRSGGDSTNVAFRGTPVESYIYKLGITVDGGGSVISTGVKGFTSVPNTGTITRARLLADQSGSVVFDIWKDIFGNFPVTALLHRVPCRSETRRSIDWDVLRSFVYQNRWS